jgi:DNA-binding HxlR family transcriptional regulator
MPLGSDYPDQNCVIARSLGVIGERWTFLILRDAFYGRTRYDEFQQSLGVATNVLSARLKKLVEAGILERPDGPRGAYRLTKKGRDLLPVLLNLVEWGNTYAPSEDGPVVETVHCECCGAPVDFRAAATASRSHRTPA